MKEYNSATVVESTIFDLQRLIVNENSLTTFCLLTITHAILIKNTVLPLCEDPSSLFRLEASGNPIILNGLVTGQN